MKCPEIGNLLTSAGSLFHKVEVTTDNACVLCPLAESLTQMSEAVREEYKIKSSPVDRKVQGYEMIAKIII